MLIVDDEAVLRAGLRLIVDGARGIEVVGEAADGISGLAQAMSLRPDVILLDIRMPHRDGLETLTALREAGSSARVVMLTAFDTDDFLLRALREGAVSFLLKDSPPEEVVQAVLDAAADRPRFSPAVASRLVRAATGAEAGPDPAGGAAAETAPPEGVTAREWEVAQLIAEGLSNAEIGEVLFMSVATVKTHLGRLYAKLQVTNRVHLALRVRELGG